jgi:hypothetical protein
VHSTAATRVTARSSASAGVDETSTVTHVPFAGSSICLGSRYERTRWLRDTRREAYLEYAGAVHAIQRLTDDHCDEAEAARIRLRQALTAISLIGPRRPT